MPVDIAVEGHILLATINRPEARNAVNDEVARGIEAAVDRLEEEQDLWIGILTGVPPVFSAGADLKMISAGRALELSTKKGGFAGITRRQRIKPMIAAVDGPALAGGTEIVLSCDLVVASENAAFGIPEVKRSLVAAGGALFRLPQRIPFNAAMELALTGDPIDAYRASELGLVNKVCEAGNALNEARALAEKVTANAPVAVRESRQILIEAGGLTEDEAWKRSEEGMARAMSSEDFGEGLTAFIEKRPPRWRGA